MLKIEKTVLPSPEQWEIIIEGMRNPMNSWGKMDSRHCSEEFCGCAECDKWVDYNERMVKCDQDYIIGENDHKLMSSLAKGGAVHAKYRRMIPVWVTINAPLYFWKEMDRYQVGTVTNSCSTMHKIHAKEFTLADFSCEHLNRNSMRVLEETITALNTERENFLFSGNKYSWWQMIQLLPTSYNQKRTVMLNYEVLVNIYHSRKNHKLDEWHTFCDWIKELPYSELITGE